MRNGSPHPSVSESKTLESQPLDRNLAKLSDVIRVRADFGVGFVTIMDVTMVDSSADVEMNDSESNRQYEPNDEMTSSKSVEGSQGSRENLDINPFEPPTRKRQSPTYTHGSEELVDIYSGINIKINSSKKFKVSSDDLSQRDCYSEQKADHSKSDIILIGSVLNASLGNTSPEKVGALEQVVMCRDKTVSKREAVNVVTSNTAVQVEETNDESVDAQIGLVPDAEPSEHSGSHVEINDPETFEEVKERNSDLHADINADAAISSYIAHTPSVSNIDMNPSDEPQVEITPESNHTPSLDRPLSTDVEMDQVMEERSLQGENPNSNLIAEMTIHAIPSDQKLTLSASNIDMNLNVSSLVASAPESEHTPYLIVPHSTGAQELRQSEQPHSSEEVTPKVPEENGIASPQPLPPSDFQLEFFSPAEDETSTSKEEGGMTGTTAATNNLWNQNNPNLVEDEISDTGDPKQQTTGSEMQRLLFNAKSPQSDSSTKAEPRLLNSAPSSETTTIILSDDEDGNLHNETREFQTTTKAILPLEGRTLLPEPPKRTLALKEAAARLACTRTDNEQQLKTNSQDVQAGIHLRTILEKRATDTITFPELRKVIFQGMPTPPRIYKIQVEPNSNLKKHDHGINDGVTKKMTWITGSYHLQRYFCWPCLLFSTEVWEIPVTSGFDDVFEAAKVHQITTSHMSANIKLLVQETALKREQKTKLKADCESRIQFELLLKRLIEIACSNNSTSTIDEYVELMDSACSNDVDVQEFLDKKTAVSKTTSFLEHFVITNIPVILEAMERLLHYEIIAEIEKAQFVTVIFEEMRNVVDKSSVAVILRYISEFGVPRERFVKMIKLGSSRTVADLLQTMNLLVQEYQLKEKLVGFTYSGTVISAREVLIFNKTVNRLYPKARFFPYQEHNFKRIIEQSLSHYPACRHFFYTINELAEFLEKSPNVMETLNTLLGMPDSEQITWDFVNDFVTTLKNGYKTIMEFFDVILKDDSGWDPVIVMQAEYFSHFLNSPNCQILVMVVSTILEAANDLCSALQGSVNIELWKQLLSETRNKLSEMKKAGLGEMLQASEPLAVATEYAKLFDQIIETAILTVNHRLADLEMAFVGQPFIEVASQCDGDALLAYQQRVGMNPENFFQLQIEAKSFFGDSPSAINIEQVIKSIYNSNMNHAKRLLLKFLQLSQTIPTRESYTSDSKPATHALRSYIATTKSQNTLDLLILTGKDILSRMRQEEEFYDMVLELCLQKNSTELV